MTATATKPRTAPASRSRATRGSNGSKKKTTRSPGKRRWSQHVTDTSDAMSLEDGVFKKKSPKAIAESLKHSAQSSERRKSSPYRSALSMLTFYINRGGRNLPARVKRVLERAKKELRALFGR